MILTPNGVGEPAAGGEKIDFWTSFQRSFMIYPPQDPTPWGQENENTLASVVKFLRSINISNVKSLNS